MIKKIVISLLIILNANAQTNVSGVIESGTTWGIANSPFIVTGNIAIAEGITLKIEPGVEVKFDAMKKLVVKGILEAKGTKENPIIFTSNNSNPKKGDWAGIHFNDTSPDGSYFRSGNGPYQNSGGSVLNTAI